MKKLLVTLCLSYLVLLPSLAQQGEPQIRAAISRATSSIVTLQCDFVQTKHLKMLNDKMVSKGKLYYRQGNRLRWEYVAPYSYTFILNSDKVLLKSSQRSDVIDIRQNRMFSEIARMMMSSVVGDCLSDGKRFRSSIATANGEWTATLLPLRKETKQLFQKIVLRYSKTQKVVTAVELTEKNGDKTVIELTNIRKNEPVDANMFAVP